MGNIIISEDLINIASGSVTARSTYGNYAAGGVIDKWHLKRAFIANDATANDYLLELSFTSSAVKGVFLQDVNFNKVKIQAYSGSWSDATSDLTIAYDPVVRRRKIFTALDLSAVTKIRIFIPTGTTIQTTDDLSTSKWQVGGVVVLSNYTAFSENMGWGYTTSAENQVEDIGVGGTFQRAAINDTLQWTGTLVLPNRDDDNIADLNAINKIRAHTPMIFYENLSDTSRAYLCIKQAGGGYKLDSYGTVSNSSIVLKEII